MERKNNGLTVILAISAIAGIAYRLLNFYNKFKEFAKKLDVAIFDIAIDTAKTQAANFGRIYFKTRLYIINPTEFTGTAQGITAALIINEKTTAIFKRDLNTTIIAKGKTPIVAELIVNSSELGETLISLGTGGLKNLNFRVKGSIIVNKITIPFNLPVTLK